MVLTKQTFQNLLVVAFALLLVLVLYGTIRDICLIGLIFLILIVIYIICAK